jgi:hypothetical protein
MLPSEHSVPNDSLACVFDFKFLILRNRWLEPLPAVSPSACCNAKAICCSVNFDFFIGQASLPEIRAVVIAARMRVGMLPRAVVEQMVPMEQDVGEGLVT